MPEEYFSNGWVPTMAAAMIAFLKPVHLSLTYIVLWPVFLIWQFRHDGNVLNRSSGFN
jgi:hypothetical protein